MVANLLRLHARSRLRGTLLLPLLVAACGGEPTVLLGRLMGAAPTVDASGQPSPPDEPDDHADHADHADHVSDSDEVDKSTELARAEKVVDAGPGPAPFDASVGDASSGAVLDSGDGELQDAGEQDAAARPREPGAPRGEPMPDAARPDMDPRWPDGGRGGHEGEHERE